MNFLNSSLIITCTAAIAVTSFIIYFYSKKKLSYWSSRGVHQLKDSHWLFGDFKDGILFKTAPGSHLGKIYKKSKDNWKILGFYIFHKPCIMVRDPEIIKQILIKDFENFSDRNFAGTQEKDSIGMRNLFGIRNPAWRYLRQKISPTFTTAKLKLMLPLMLENVEPMLKYIDKMMKRGVDRFDVQELNYKYATDLIANVALGTMTDSFNRPDAEFTQAVSAFFHGFKRMVALVTVFFVPELVDWLGAPVLFNSDFVRKVFWTAVKEREKTGERRGDYIDTIIQLQNGEQNPLYRFEGENLLFQSGTFFSGFESSATAASFALLELARHRRHQDAARADVRRATERHGWSFEAFSSMRCLERCVLEAARLHPPVASLDRRARRDCKLPGSDVIIEKGTAVYVSLYGLHEDPKFFPDPLVFNPDRFDTGKKVSDAYVAFGAGPRMCIGKKLGEIHVKVILSTILSRYELSCTAEETPLDPRSTFTAAKEGIRLTFKSLEEHADQDLRATGAGAEGGRLDPSQCDSSLKRSLCVPQ